MNWLSEGLVITICVGVAYLLAFAFEGGFVSTWNIPIEYVKINLSTVLVTAAMLLLVLVPFLFCWTAFVGKYLNQITPRRLLLVLLALAILCGIIAVISFVQWKEKVWIVVVVVVSVFALVALPRIVEKVRINYTDGKLKTEWGVKKMILMAFLVLLLAIGTSYLVGRLRASTQRQFLIPGREKDVVVLRIYGDNLICARFNKDGEKIKITEDFVILPARRDTKVELSWKKVERQND